MADGERKDPENNDPAPPIDPPLPDEERYRLNTGTRSEGSDAGRTGGGGSLGHVQPDKVTREAPLRNNAAKRESDEPTLPSNDATVRTKI
jgi:hypothetical protein